MMKLVFLCSALVGITPTTAKASENRCVSGTFPSKVPAITIDNSSGSGPKTVGAVLEQVSKQAGWSLLLLSHTSFDNDIDVHATAVPANELLETLCTQGHLKIELKGTTLRVVDNEDDESDNSDNSDDGDATGADAARAEADSHHFHHDDRIVTGQDLVIGEEEEVNDAVATGGSLEVKGHVRGSAVAIGGKLTIRSTARVDGDAVGIGGPMVVEPGAKLHGDRVSVGGSVGSVIRGLAERGLLNHGSSAHDDDDSSDHDSGLSRFFGKFLRTLLGFLLGLLLISFSPGRVQRVSAYLEERPMFAAGAGFVLALCFIPLCVMLAITLIGIPLIPVLIVALLLLLVFGYTALMAYIGDKLPLMQGRKTPLIGLALGAAVMLLIDLIPYIGPFIVLSAALVAAGAALLSRFGSDRAPPTSGLPPSGPPPSALSTLP